jgi:hypothetical protein
MEKTNMGNPARPLESVPAPGPVPVVELPRRREVSPALNRAAERLGRAVGLAEVQLRQLPARISDLRARLNATRNRASEDAAAAASEWRQSAERTAYQARTRGQYLANEYPVQTIAGAAGAAFVTGFALRLWRSSHARR